MARKIALLIALVILVAAVPHVTSAAVMPFDAKAFADAQNAGHGIVVAINATW